MALHARALPGGTLVGWGQPYTVIRSYIGYQTFQVLSAKRIVSATVEY